MSEKLGATGKFPDGKLGPDDEGELQMGIANDGKLVHINFGKAIQWIAFPPEIAMALASKMVEHAMCCQVNSRE